MNILMLGIPFMAAALERRGHKLMTANWTPSAQIRLDHPITTRKLFARAQASGFAPDLLFYQDEGNLPALLDPENIPCPAIYYSIDTYCNPWHVGYAKGFDLTFAAQKDFLPLFLKDGIDARWLPLFNTSESNYCPGARARDVPISFVGTLGHKNNPDREPFLKRFRKLQPLVMRQGSYEEVFARSQIVLNQTAFSEINFRFFEAMACGAALLTEQCANGFEDLFTPGENILPPYPRNDAAAAAAIARKYLSQPELLREIASAGQEHVRRHHSQEARASTVEDLAREAAARAENKTEQAALRRWNVRSAFAMIALELDHPGMAAYRDFYFTAAGIKKK